MEEEEDDVTIDELYNYLCRLQAWAIRWMRGDQGTDGEAGKKIKNLAVDKVSLWYLRDTQVRVTCRQSMYKSQAQRNVVCSLA